MTFTDRWYFGVWMCDAWLSIDYCASTASIFNLFVLSLDRYWSITSPLKYLRRRTKKRAFLMIAAAWILSLLWILPVTGWSSMTDGIKLNSSPDSCDTEFADNITFKVSLLYPENLFLFNTKRKGVKKKRNEVRNCRHQIFLSRQPSKLLLIEF